MAKAPVLSIPLLVSFQGLHGQDLAARLKADAQDTRQDLAAVFVRLGHIFQRIGLDAGHGAKETELTIGHGARDAGLAVGHGAEKAGRFVGATATVLGRKLRRRFRKSGPEETAP